MALALCFYLCWYFYPRSPCGERQDTPSICIPKPGFLSTLSLRRATRVKVDGYLEFVISIHALLAESDHWSGVLVVGRAYFYPRSPCGERLVNGGGLSNCFVISIHALLAESDSGSAKQAARNSNFYPRSPCGERLSASTNYAA